MSSVRLLLAISVAARLPLAMLSLALLVHVEALTGSYGAAGAVAGAHAIALGVCGPLLGQLVDRRGQTWVLLGSASASAALLSALALAPAGAPTAALVALAAMLGAATPPLGACLRALLPRLLADPAAVRAAYGADATASELAWVAGPPLALGAGALWSTGGALAAAGVALLAGSAAFAAHPASRAWRPSGTQRGGSSLRSPSLRALVLVLLAVGTLFGAVEVAVTAAADELGGTGAAGPLLALWGAGSLVGGLVAVRWGRSLEGAGGLALVLGALTAGHLLLVPAAGSLLALGAALLVAGAAIAPTYALVYALVDGAVPEGTVTEAFAWVGTAVAIGAALGAAGAGALVDHAGVTAAFLLGGGAGAAALCIFTLGAHRFAPVTTTTA